MKRTPSIFIFAVSVIATLVMPLFTNAVQATVLIAQAAASNDVAYSTLRNGSDGNVVNMLSGNFFTVDDNIGQDIYENIYERVKSQGADLAITRTSSRRDLSKEEIYAIIPGSNIGAILSKPSPNTVLTDEQIRNRRTDLITELADEKDLADVETLLGMEVESTEIFANGDESDSGFDLLADLAIIENILFAKEFDTIPGPAGGSAGDRRLQNGGAGQNDNSNNAANGGGQNRNNNGGAVGNNGNGIVASGEIGAEVACPVDENFNAAAELSITQDTSNGNRNPNGSLNGGGNGAGGANNGDTDVDKKPLLAAEPDNWKRELPCTNFFCITFEAKYKTESSYTANENCIACHIQKINDAFDKTLKHNLIPNKVTGNLLEGPKCKDAIVGMNWITSNIIMIGQPILTPPNDDLVVRANLFDNMQLFWTRYMNSPKKCDEGEACRIGVAEQVLTQARPDATFDDTTATVAQETRAAKEKNLREFRQDQLKQQAVAQASQYQVIVQELDTMNSYFENFMQTFESLVNDPENSPCSVLAHKETCS